MIEWAVQLIALAGLLSTQTPAVVSYVESLPPRPTQAQVVCHDAAWEQQNLQVVAGAKVHPKLAPWLTQMLSDARSQGIYLNITVAYRSCDYQLQLRKMNCGLGEYNLYKKPSNECTPPTEPAGQSLHNEGLAVDFSCQGYSLIETSPCLRWLRQNAGRYQLLPHAKEAWHWSTTGL